MRVTSSNSVNIYDLSSGKGLPDWLSERKRRQLQNKDVDVRRRIQLIQDFEMPGLSTAVKLSRDGKYIIAAGIYKPRIRCFEVDHLSLKFERCFDAEAVSFELLSDDYSKFALLQCNRTVEFHVQYGTYYKIRVPRFGRDMIYHRESCDLLVAGSGPYIYRFNLEQGRFLSPYETEASSINKLAIHENYDFIACGTMEGKVESWDPRMRERISNLDCALSCTAENTIVNGFPSITSISFKGDLVMGVGTFTGQILLYDIRSSKPLLVKDHMYGLPIKNVEFIKEEDLVVSLDPKCVKFWKQDTGKPYTTIQAPSHLNDLCVAPKSGLIFVANEEKKILTYFIPSIGPAPKWCCFLDSITEELQEAKQDAVYDDYKFITKTELETLHLDHLIGSNLLRAYMHGYFMDIRLYNKAKSIVQPEAYKELKKKMVKNKIESERDEKRIQVKQLPNVNRQYAQKLLEKKTSEKLQTATPFEDDRFKDLFENPDFEIKETDYEYERIKPTIEKANKKKITMVPENERLDLYEDQQASNKSDSSDDDQESDDEDESDDCDKKMTSGKRKPTKFEAVNSDNFSMHKTEKEEENVNLPIEERLKSSVSYIRESTSAAGNKLISWTLKKAEKRSKYEEERKAHRKERAKCRRPADSLRK